MDASQQAGLGVVDFAPFLLDEGCLIGEAPTPQQLEAAKDMDRIMCSSGFLYVKNLGITNEDIAAAFKDSEELFSKDRLALFNPTTNLGHKKLGDQNVNHARAADMRESFTIRTRHCYDNDYRNAPTGFETRIHSFWDKLEDASRRFSVALALAMGLPSDELDFFSRSLKKMRGCTLGLIHYPPCDFEAGVTDGSTTDGALRVGEHTDFGLFTFLFLEGNSRGLQVKKAVAGDDAITGISDCSSSDWIEAPGLGGSIAVVNSGALLARWTNDRWRATAHRVVVPSAQDAAEHRYSIPFFAHPDPDTFVAAHPNFVPAGEQPHYAPIRAGEFLRMKLQALHEGRQIAKGGA